MLTKPNTLRLVFFLAAFAGALYYPVREVLAFERPKMPPKELRFQVKFQDPYDPMRGHYLQMNLRNDIPMPKKELKELEQSFRKRDRDWAAVLETKPNGFAEAVAVHPLRDVPKDKPFVKVDTVWFKTGNKNCRCTVTMPFDRFYINEKLAEDAEKLLRKVSDDKDRSAVLVVNVYADGRWAVKDLLVDGQPILKLLRPAAAK